MKHRKFTLKKLSEWIGFVLLTSAAIIYLVVIYVAREQFSISGLIVLLALGAVALALLAKAEKEKSTNGA